MNLVHLLVQPLLNACRMSLGVLAGIAEGGAFAFLLIFRPAFK
jgi:hypothetical protein